MHVYAVTTAKACLIGMACMHPEWKARYPFSCQNALHTTWDFGLTVTTIVDLKCWQSGMEVISCFTFIICIALCLAIINTHY